MELLLEALRPSRTLVDRVYEVILDAISDGTLKAGERIMQDEVAARLNVSRQPVMNALSLLKAQGFVIDVGRRGLQVAPVDRRLFIDIYQFRTAVEPLAVKLAVPHMQPADVDRGRDIIRRGRQGVSDGAARAVLEADIEFHSFIYRLSENEMISNSMRLNWQHLRRSMGVVLQYPGMSMSVWQEHAEIFEGMVQGEATRAAALMEQHMARALDRVVGSLEPPAEPT
jgi:DNA-binding GntR family transcriptional regulator